MIYALPAPPGRGFVIEIMNRVKPTGYPRPLLGLWKRPICPMEKAEQACGKGAKPTPQGSVASPSIGRKIFLELAFFALEILGVGRGFLLLGNIWPGFGIFAVHFKPLFEPRLGIRLDRVGGTFGLAHAAIDALVRMDDQHVLALVKAIDGADFNAVGIFAFDAGFSDDVSHPRLRNGQFSLGCLAHEPCPCKGADCAAAASLQIVTPR